MRNLLIALSTILVLSSPIVYIHSILHGQTRPHRTTRFVIMVITLLSTWALFSSKGAAFWLAAASAAQALAVFVLSLKRGMGGWSRLDIICLAIALVGIVIWQTTGKPIIGLYASILADFVGYVPAFVKTYKLPHTENWQFFAMDAIAAVLSFAALASYDALALSYPIYIFLANIGMVTLIFSRRRNLAVQ